MKLFNAYEVSVWEGEKSSGYGQWQCVHTNVNVLNSQNGQFYVMYTLA